MPLSTPLRYLSALALTLASLPGAGCYAGVDPGTDDTASGGQSGLTAGDSAGDDSAGEDPGDDSAGEGPEPTLAPAPATLRRLLQRHYRNAVRDLLGEAAAAAVHPPTDSPLNGFDAVGAAQFALSDAAVDAYEASARAAAAAAVACLDEPGEASPLAAHLGCTPSAVDDAACHASILRSFGRLAWRRPLTEDEVTRYVAVAREAALAAGDFNAGVENAVATLLQSPHFLYMVEIGAPDPEDPSRRYLTGSEMATRLAFFLHDSTPPPWLLDAADDGLLGDAAGIREAATLLLNEPAARVTLDNFFSEVFRLRELETLAKDPTVWPQWSPALAEALRRETLLLLQDVIWQRDADFREIFDAPYTFANNLVGPLYGLTPPGGGAWSENFIKTPLPEASKRGGILGQGALMARFAHITSSSPTLRGKFVREALLCESIPAPPNDVSTVIPPAGEAAPTMRERLEQHLTDPTCANCHLAMDPIGFGLENYDGIGIFRTVENGETIDTLSELAGQPFDGARELGALLREQRGVSLCALRNLFRHATGHIETSGELPTLIALEALLASRGFRLQELLVELVANPTFRMVGTPE